MAEVFFSAYVKYSLKDFGDSNGLCLGFTKAEKSAER